MNENNFLWCLVGVVIGLSCSVLLLLLTPTKIKLSEYHINQVNSKLIMIHRETGKAKIIDVDRVQLIIMGK